MSIAEAPEFDVLLVPGGDGQQQLMDDEEVLSLGLWTARLKRSDPITGNGVGHCQLMKPEKARMIGIQVGARHQDETLLEEFWNRSVER